MATSNAARTRRTLLQRSSIHPSLQNPLKPTYKSYITYLESAVAGPQARKNLEKGKMRHGISRTYGPWGVPAASQLAEKERGKKMQKCKLRKINIRKKKKKKKGETCNIPDTQLLVGGESILGNGFATFFPFIYFVLLRNLTLTQERRGKNR